MIFQETESLIGNDVNFLVILLVHRDATLILKHLQGRVDHTGAWSVATRVLDGLDNAIPVKRSRAKRHEHKEPNVAALHSERPKLRYPKKLIVSPFFPYTVSWHDKNLIISAIYLLL
jgi:hypothetical protein